LSEWVWVRTTCWTRDCAQTNVVVQEHSFIVLVLRLKYCTLTYDTQMTTGNSYLTRKQFKVSSYSAASD
jgi:hypothetical protein